MRRSRQRTRCRARWGCACCQICRLCEVVALARSQAEDDPTRRGLCIGLSSCRVAAGICSALIHSTTLEPCHILKSFVSTSCLSSVPGCIVYRWTVPSVHLLEVRGVELRRCVLSSGEGSTSSRRGCGAVRGAASRSSAMLPPAPTWSCRGLLYAAVVVQQQLFHDAEPQQYRLPPACRGGR